MVMHQMIKESVARDGTYIWHMQGNPCPSQKVFLWPLKMIQTAILISLKASLDALFFSQFFFWDRFSRFKLVSSLNAVTSGATTWFHKVRAVTQDAVCVSRLRSCGVIFIGKANMHELGLGTTGNNPNYGQASSSAFALIFLLCTDVCSSMFFRWNLM